MTNEEVQHQHVFVSCGNGGECDVCKCAHDERAPSVCPGPPIIKQNLNVQFLRDAARYFAQRPTNGEDKAHWANTFNAEGCHKAADYIEALAAENERLRAEIARLREADYKSFTDGMEAAAQICGTLAEVEYDDADAFEAATGCEAAIMRVVKQQRGEQGRTALKETSND